MEQKINRFNKIFIMIFVSPRSLEYKMFPLIFHHSFQASFLIPPEAVAGRLTLLVTLFLVLINILNTITNNSPNVEGLTSISAWVIICILFVFGALVVFAALVFRKNTLGKVSSANNFIYKCIFLDFLTF